MPAHRKVYNVRSGHLQPGRGEPHADKSEKGEGVTKKVFSADVLYRQPLSLLMV